MRQKRAKIYKKLMHLYHLTFGFREPYQVLVDSTMCTAATAHKIDLVTQLKNILQGNVKPMITQCSIVELYKLGKSEQPSVDLAKSFERRRCNHREAINGIECIASVVGQKNKHCYIVASQSDETRLRLRGIPGTPLVHLNRTVMVLEPPSDATLNFKRQTEEKALLPSVPDPKPPENVEQPKKARKGPKQPNPLSVKKKKVRTQPRGTSTNAGDGQLEGQVKAGIKRKLDGNEDSGSHSQGHSHGENEKEKHFRKRRKKSKMQNKDATE